MCNDDHHDRLRASSDWASLPFVGMQPLPQDQCAELRNCPFCQSTLAKVISKEEALAVLDQLEVLIARSRYALS